MSSAYQCLSRQRVLFVSQLCMYICLMLASVSYAQAQEWKAVSTGDGFRLHKVVFEDLRPEVSTRGIELPFISTPGQFDRVWPKIGETEENSAKAAIQGYFRGNDQAAPVTVRYQLLSAYQQFSATMSAEREDAFVRIRMDILDENDNVLFTSTTEKSLRKNRLDATYKSIARLYQTAWDQTIAECLRALSPPAAIGQLN